MSQPVNVTCLHQTADVSPEREAQGNPHTTPQRGRSGAGGGRLSGNHPIRVTTVHPAGSRVRTTVTPPAVKVENVADDGSSGRSSAGGDHRLPLQLDHRGQQPPVDPAAQDRGRRRDLPGRLVQRRRPSPQGLDQGRGPRRCARPIRGPPARPEAASSFSTRPHPGRRDWPVALATGRMRAPAGANQTWRTACTASSEANGIVPSTCL